MRTVGVTKNNGCLSTVFFAIVDTCLSCEDIAGQSCAMVPRWRIFGDFLRPVLSANCCTLENTGRKNSTHLSLSAAKKSVTVQKKQN